MHRLAIPLCLALAAISLAGCSLIRPTESWVEMGADGDAVPLSETIVVFVAQSVPVAGGAAIILAAPPATQAANLVSLQVREKLEARGYTIAAGDAAARHRLRYLISTYGNGIILRITLDETEASVLFARDSGGLLRAGAPLAMRQNGKVL